jgi:hypothetical protein
MVNHVEGEDGISQQLSLCDHCHHIQIALQQTGTNVYRLYSDYAEHRDLRDLLNIYHEEVNLGKQIPEQLSVERRSTKRKLRKGREVRRRSENPSRAP